MVLLLTAVAVFLATGPQTCPAVPGEEDAVCEMACELLRRRIETAGFPPRLSVGEDVIYASETLPEFYERRAYRLVWSGSSRPLDQAGDLIRVLEGAADHGLKPEHYHLRRLRRIMDRIPLETSGRRPVLPRLLVDLDLLLTDAFMIYAYHLTSGRLDAESTDPEWHVYPTEVDLLERLQYAVDRNLIEEVLAGLAPDHHCYRGLVRWRGIYEAISLEGGWPEIPDGETLEKGDRGERVRTLRRRLAAEGYVRPGGKDAFDEGLEEGVRAFQRRHGLEVDGIVGRNTLAALRVPARQRAGQIEVNLERWRWLPRDLGSRYIMVNIAGFDLRVLEAGEEVMTMKVIVGRDYRRTPVFSDVMTYLVINPYWHIPTSLAVKDKIPLILKDPDYLERQGITVFSGWGEGARELDPDSVDWESMSVDYFPYRLRQDPGAQNPLGSIKFMFPNRFSVYLHDTPDRSVFDRPERAVSSGCIRVGSPVDLAEYLLRASPEWTRAAILKTIKRGLEETVRLPEPIAVHLFYCTAWIDDRGEIHFRRDIYGRDGKVLGALGELPPAS
jgi:murein L,D-transpeptidase YcbB/YkuD